MQVMNYRPKTLYPGDFNKDHFSEMFFKNFKGNLLVVGSFLLALKNVTMCFKLNIFNNFTGNVLEEIYLEILQVATRILIYYRLFCGDNLQKFSETVSDGVI